MPSTTEKRVGRRVKVVEWGCVLVSVTGSDLWKSARILASSFRAPWGS